MNSFKSSMIGLVVAVGLALTGCATTTSAQEVAPSADGIRYVSVEQIEASLPPQPIIVGFDVDDTVLFSSPGFYYGSSNADGPGGTNKYGADWSKNKQFWADMNGQFERFSIPKKAARKVIEMHKRRGDKIYFITARYYTEGEQTTAHLKRVFDLPSMEPVIFTDEKSKAPFIKERGLIIYYGDSDSDIKDAKEAGVRGIRIVRASNSTNTGPASPGKHDEEVIKNSEF